MDIIILNDLIDGAILDKFRQLYRFNNEMLIKHNITTIVKILDDIQNNITDYYRRYYNNIYVIHNLDGYVKMIEDYKDTLERILTKRRH